MSENQTTHSDDEIDLMDLFIVLLKHRKLILRTLIVVFVIGLAAYFIYPSWKYKQTSIEETTTTICRVMTGPSLREGERRLELITLFNSTPAVLVAMENAGINRVGNISLDSLENRQRALNWLENNFPLQIIDENNDLDRKNYTVNPTSQIVKISYINSNPEQAEDFLASLFDQINTRLADSTAYPDDSLILFDPPYTVLEKSLEPSLSQVRISYLKKFFIVLFSVFSLLLFMAFVLEFIDNIKHDEQRISKLRKALKKD